MTDIALRRATLIIGALEGLLTARLLLKLLAARPDNVVFAVLFRLTDPFTMLLAFLDARQPRFGAVLEFSTLAWMLLLLAVLGVLRFVNRRQHHATAMPHRTSNS